MTNKLSSDDYFDEAEQEAMLADESGEEALLSRIPLQVGTQRKALYLSYRATGFPVKQAIDLAETSLEELHRWRRNDEHFRAFENEKLQELQATVGSDVVRLEFLRNFRMIMKKDFLVIRKALFDEANLTDSEWKYFLMVRKHYTPNDMLALEKAISPETHNDKTTIVVELNWGGSTIEATEELEQAAKYRELPDGSNGSG